MRERKHARHTLFFASLFDARSSSHILSSLFHLISSLVVYLPSLISHRSSLSHLSLFVSLRRTLSLIVRSSLLCSSLLSCVRLDSSSLFHLIASLVLRLISHRLSLFLSLSLISHLIISSFVSLSSHHLVFRLSSLFTLELIIYLPNSSLLRNQASLRRACCVRWGGGGATHHPGHAACA